MRQHRWHVDEEKTDRKDQMLCDSICMKFWNGQNLSYSDRKPISVCQGLELGTELQRGVWGIFAMA